MKTISPEVLKNLCDAVVKNPRFQPTWILKTDLLETYCNFATRLIAKTFGCHLKGMANQITKYIEKSPEWKEVSFLEAHELARKGHLVVTAKTAFLHGHVAVIYPADKMGTSAKWDCAVPIVCNVGNNNKIVGLNWVFRDKPKIHVWNPKPINQDDLEAIATTDYPAKAWV